MKQYQAYLIDLDGTMYRGNTVIPEAIKFVDNLNSAQIPHLFVTNNSTTTPSDVAKRLQGMGIQASVEEVFTSAQATAAYMNAQSQTKTVYTIGEQGLLTALAEQGFIEENVNPAFVVVGMDRNFNYNKLATAALAIRSGATFLSTNADRAVPTEGGLLPGNGSITAALAVATGVEPIFVGKPEPIIMSQALAKLAVKKEDAIMVGDNYETDILGGIHYGMDTLIVHTGFTSPADLETKELKPTYSVKTLAEWQAY